MLKKQVPNLITLLNLLSGCIGVILAMQNNLVGAAIFVGLGIFFDYQRISTGNRDVSIDEKIDGCGIRIDPRMGKWFGVRF